MSPRIFTVGEIMARLAAPGHQRFSQAMPGTLEVTFAGAEANVAAAIAGLGGDAAFVTALPRHDVAETAVAALRGTGVDVRHILRTDSGRLGLFFLETGALQRGSQVIYDRAGSSFSVTPPECYDWPAILRGASWMHLSGITPAISATGAAVAAAAMQAAAEAGVAVSFDMNFRAKLWQWEPGTDARELAARTVRGLLPWVQLFTGGVDDIALLTGECFQSSACPREAAAWALIRRWPNIRRVAMTVRETISAAHHRLGGFLYDSGADASFTAPEGGSYEMPQIVDRLGGGDAFAAGLLFALSAQTPADPQRAIAFATATSCLAHTVPGDFARVRAEEVEALLRGGSGGSVQR